MKVSSGSVLLLCGIQLANRLIERPGLLSPALRCLRLLTSSSCRHRSGVTTLELFSRQALLSITRPQLLTTRGGEKVKLLTTRGGETVKLLTTRGEEKVKLLTKRGEETVKLWVFLLIKGTVLMMCYLQIEPLSVSISLTWLFCMLLMERFTMLPTRGLCCLSTKMCTSEIRYFTYFSAHSWLIMLTTNWLGAGNSMFYRSQATGCI